MVQGLFAAPNLKSSSIKKINQRIGDVSFNTSIFFYQGGEGHYQRHQAESG